MEVTADDYRAFYGEIAEEDFSSALPVAEAEVRDLAGFNRPRTPLQEDAWKRAVCAVVRADRSYGFSHGTGDGLAGFTIGKFSATAGGSGASSWKSDVQAAARRELVGSGLLYAGLA
ncbi:hypothetical protein [Parvibacter caecicola]|uniref:hypothetical protein n=1 Tax=Parvibacter caecicola TaxID=747645 RepID=UPI002731A5A5|nr:hypothetical protein [Parvibacter caecicola]